MVIAETLGPDWIELKEPVRPKAPSVAEGDCCPAFPDNLELVVNDLLGKHHSIQIAPRWCRAADAPLPRKLQ